MNDGRQLVGQMLAFDKHMNLVLADCEEFRKVKRKTKGAQGGQQTVETEEKRTLGLAIVRGANVVSCSVDGPPPADPAARLGTSATGPTPPTAMQAGPGISRPAGRGAGLQGPAVGMGGQFPGFPGVPGGRGVPREFNEVVALLDGSLMNNTAGFPPPGGIHPGGPPRKY